MANIPFLPVTIVAKVVGGSVSTNSFYTNPSSLYDGYPYTYNLTLELVPVLNSDDRILPNAYTYDANNIQVGMWIGQPNGLAYEIISINTVTSGSLVDVTVKDVDLFNILSDTTFSGNNAPLEESYGVIFGLSEDGDPVLNGLELQRGNLSDINYWVNDFYGRFQYRNLISTYYNNDSDNLVYGTGYTVGQVVYLDSTGQFQIVDDTDQAQLEKAFGIITSVNEPEDGNMTVRPFGKITGGLDLSGVGNIGDVLYYDMSATTNNYATDVKPTSNPLPVYIKISNTTASLIGWPLVPGTGGSGTGGVAGTSGSSGESGTSGSSGLSFNWLGVWDGTVGGGSNISYGLNDVVYYNGTTYIFTNTTPSGIGSAEPGTNPDWETMAVSGANGTSGSSGFSGASVTGATLTNTILELQNSDNTTVQVEFDPSTSSQSKEGVTTHGFLFLDETAFTGDTFNNVFTTSAITDNIQVYYLDNSQLTAKLTYVVLDIGNFTTVSENKVLVLPQLTGSFESKVIKFIMKRNDLDDNRDVMIGSKWISSGNSDRIIAANINTKLTNSGYFFPIEPLESVEILYDGYDWLVVNTQKQQYVQATPVNYLLYGTNGTAGSFKNRDISNLL